jgi:hypothetical protein
MSESGVRRDKAVLSSGYKSHPANVPAGSNRSSYEPVRTQPEAMVDLMPLTGLIGTAQLEVEAEHTAPFVGSGRIAVLATPVMINIIEAAALNAIKHLLPAGHRMHCAQLFCA